MSATSRLFLTLGLLLGLAGLFAGCELNDDASDAPDGPNALEISPSYEEISTRTLDSILFQASGGTPPYTWALSATNTTLGTLSANGHVAVYTPRAVAGSLFVLVHDSAGTEASATLIQK